MRSGCLPCEDCGRDHHPMAECGAFAVVAGTNAAPAIPMPSVDIARMAADLAALRAENERLVRERDEAHEAEEREHHENLTLRADVARLGRDLNDALRRANACQGSENIMAGWLTEQTARAERAEAEVGRLREALAFYADPFTYSDASAAHPGARFSRPIAYDTPQDKRGALWAAGERARAALAPAETKGEG